MKRKLFLISLFFSILQVTSHSQSVAPGNSFESLYKSSNRNVNYRYNLATQVHDYSGNWDLDGDRQLDNIYFIGTGGAHLYFYLRVILSTDGRIRDYTFLQTDFPVFTGKIDESIQDSVLSIKSGFSASDWNGDERDDILLHLDFASCQTWNDKLIEGGIRSCDVFISFKKEKIDFFDFIQ